MAVQKSKSGDMNSFEHLVEPPFDLERGRELNERAGENDPDFKKSMEERRKKAAEKG